MRLFEIKRIIEEMISDVKIDISLNKGQYDFRKRYSLGDAKEYAEKAFLAHEKKAKLEAVNLNLFSINGLKHIEEFLISLKKVDYFTEDEINAFLKEIIIAGRIL